MITFKFSASAPGRKKGEVCGVATLKGTTKRAVYPIENLLAPNPASWNKDTQRFEEATETAIINNNLLDDFREKCLNILKQYEVKEPKELFDIIRNGGGRKRVRTLGDFVEQVIYDMRYCNNNKKLSWNYKKFVNLLNKLKKEGEIINVQIEAVSNSHFIDFSDFILSLSDKEGRSNYCNLMKLFKQIHSKAYERGLNDNILRFKYNNYAPIKKNKGKKPPLTVEEYDRFVNLDVKATEFKRWRLSQLYKDFCIFLYESKSRPIDIIQLHYNNIKSINGKTYFIYTPEKKKNSNKNSALVECLLTQNALNIITQYRSSSINGYVFPFAINAHVYDKTDPDDYNSWMKNETHTLEQINRWLKIVGTVIGLDFPLTIYAFRRTSLTHACANDPNYLKIALQAGTSTAMLEEHYVSLSRQ